MSPVQIAIKETALRGLSLLIFDKVAFHRLNGACNVILLRIQGLASGIPSKHGASASAAEAAATTSETARDGTVVIIPGMNPITDRVNERRGCEYNNPRIRRVRIGARKSANRDGIAVFDGTLNRGRLK